MLLTVNSLNFFFPPNVYLMLSVLQTDNSLSTIHTQLTPYKFICIVSTVSTAYNLASCALCRHRRICNISPAYSRTFPAQRYSNIYTRTSGSLYLPWIKYRYCMYYKNYNNGRCLPVVPTPKNYIYTSLYTYVYV